MTEAVVLFAASMVVTVGVLIIEVWAWRRRAQKVVDAWLDYNRGRSRRDRIALAQTIYHLSPVEFRRRLDQRDRVRR